MSTRSQNVKSSTSAKADGQTPEDVRALGEGEPSYRYSVESVATIAAHFVDGNTTEAAACERAIKLLDAASETIRRKTIWLRARAKAETLSRETPKHLGFAKGLRWLFGRASETKNVEPFRSYLRLNVRLCDLGRPSQLTDEQAKTLLAPLPEGAEKEAEDTRIQAIEKRYRENGFNQVDLVSIREESDFLKSRVVLPLMNSEKGKQGGRPRGAKDSSKNSLVRTARRKN